MICCILHNLFVQKVIYMIEKVFKFKRLQKAIWVLSVYRNYDGICFLSKYVCLKQSWYFDLSVHKKCWFNLCDL